jgi:hypothetical protein
VNALAIVGLAVIVASEAATLAGNRLIGMWNTPICWSGFILFADSVVYRARGNSWIRSSPREFVFLAIASIPLWLIFEVYNLFIRNWHYVGLPENAALRYFGYAWSFATIWPAIFEGAEFFAVFRAGQLFFTGAGARLRSPTTLRATAGRPPGRRSAKREGGSSAHSRGRFHPALPALSIIVGAAMLIWPLVWPSPYLAAPVWLGFIFLLDPINARLGPETLWGDLASGQYDRLKNLILSGFLCGVLWEFWNYWAVAKWHYTVPIMENLKIFEMPVPGYLGFPAFALECFTMYVFVRAVVRRHPGRTIAL